MEKTEQTGLLDFLAEGFLQQGASVSYITLDGASALKVIPEDELPKIYFTAEKEPSKVFLLKKNFSEEIIIPVLRSDEEFRLRSVLRRAGIAGVEVQRLSILQRYSWYSRKLKG